MKKFICMLAAMLTFSIMCSAQNVTKEGNTFVQQKSGGKSSAPATKTEYTYKDSKGNSYPIYLSASGKAFVYKTSKNTGKEYKMYLPKVTEQIPGGKPTIKTKNEKKE